MPALGLDFERTLRVQPADARGVVVDALRETGFQLTAEQLTRVEAKRGNKWLAGAFMPVRLLPIVAWFDIVPSGTGCSVSGHLVDDKINIGGKAWGWNQTYRQLFDELVAAVDRGLARLDPAAAAAFTQAQFWTKGGDVAILEQAQSASAKAGTTVLDKAGGVLDGGSKEAAPAAWKGVDSVTFRSARGVAVLSLAETQAHLGVAVMIGTQPGAMPPNLSRDVELLAARIEQALTMSPGRAVTIDIEEPERPVVEFLQQQVRIREGLPVRTLHVCKTCHFQKITNEDFARIQVRNQRLRGLVGGVGATISSGGVQPFVILGQLFKLKKLDPDYVCPRCQGLDADERVVTFCPTCGEMRAEAVLRECRKCKFDFRSRLTAQAFWLPLVEVAAPAGPAPLNAGVSLSMASPAPEGSREPGSNGWSFCPTCGSQLAGGFAFCPGCGTRI